MTIVEYGSVRIEVSEDGFLAQPEAWTEAVALALASAQGVSELTPRHWALVKHIRAHWLRFGVAPMIRNLCRDTRTPLKEVYELFPAGPAKGVCKVAGLPNAAGCV
jgi:tRNA 2-thiouridine synthesizing protein E